MEQQEIGVLDGILSSRDNNKTALIGIMQDIQHEYRYLPRQALEYIALKLDISPAKIYSVATFYENFSLEPKGKYVIRVCDGTACHIRKSIPILNALRESLGLSEKEKTTGDMLITVETVSCLGACGLAPAMSINSEIHAAMTPEKVRACLDEIREDGKAHE